MTVTAAPAPSLPRDVSTVAEGVFVYRNARDHVSDETTAADHGTTIIVELSPNRAPLVYGCGPEPTHRRLAAPPGVVCVGVRLRPGVLPALFGVMGEELVGGCIALDDVVPKETRRVIDSASSPEHVLTALLDLVRRRSRAAPPSSAGLMRVHSAVSLLAGPRPMPIDEVVRELRTSPRTLRREFAAVVGLGPKRFSRVVRLRRAALRVGSVPLATLALDLGFADQAHMTREFVALLGVAPRALRGMSLPFVPGTTGSLVA